MRFLSVSEKDERDEGMLGPGGSRSWTLSVKAPGAIRGVSSSSVPSLATATSIKELAPDRVADSSPRDLREAASSLRTSELSESRLFWAREERGFLAGREAGGGMDRLAWSAWISVIPGSACLPLWVKEELRTEEKDEVREAAGPPGVFVG